MAPVALPWLLGPLPSGACVSRTELGTAAGAYRGALIGRFDCASFDFGLSQHSIGTRKAQAPFAILLIMYFLRVLLVLLRFRQITFPCFLCHCSLIHSPMDPDSGRSRMGARRLPMKPELNAQPKLVLHRNTCGFSVASMKQQRAAGKPRWGPSQRTLAPRSVMPTRLCYD
jgi:hypothetical protein